jgi:hypothetical protein
LKSKWKRSIPASFSRLGPFTSCGKTFISPETFRVVPDAPPLDEEPPYFIDEAGSFETEIDISDAFPTSNRPQISADSARSAAPSRSVAPSRSFQAPSLVPRSLPTRPTYRNENSGAATQTQNRDANRDSSSESIADAPWLDLSAKELAAAWLDATRKLGCILPTQAATFCSVATEAPDVFVVSFPGSKRQERDYCEREKEKIGASLAQRLGASASIRCLLDPSKTDADILAPPSERGGANFNGSGNFSGGNGFNGPGGAEIGGRSPRPAQGRNAPPAPGVRDLYRQLAQHEAVVELRELFEAELTEIKPPRPSAPRPVIAPPPSADVVDDPDDSDDD